MLQRILPILVTPVAPRPERRCDPLAELPEDFWHRLARHPRHAIQRYSDWRYARAQLPGLDSLARWDRQQAAERLDARQALLNPKPLATVVDDRRVLRRRVTDRVGP